MTHNFINSGKNTIINRDNTIEIAWVGDALSVDMKDICGAHKSYLTFKFTPPFDKCPLFNLLDAMSGGDAKVLSLPDAHCITIGDANIILTTSRYDGNRIESCGCNIEHKVHFTVIDEFLMSDDSRIEFRLDDDGFDLNISYPDARDTAQFVFNDMDYEKWTKCSTIDKHNFADEMVCYMSESPGCVVYHIKCGLSHMIVKTQDGKTTIQMT